MKAKMNRIIQQAEAEINFINSDAGSPDYQVASKQHAAILEEAATTGATEGKRNQPGKNTPVNDYEVELITKYVGMYRNRISNEKSLVKQLHSRYKSLLQRLYSTNEGNILYTISEIKTNFHKAKINNKRPTGETNAIKFLLKHQWFIYLVLMTLGLLELPLNITVFKAFRLDDFSTLLAGTLLVISIPIIAHFCGKFFKRWKEHASNKVISLSLFLILTSFGIFMSLFRYVYFQAQALKVAALEAGSDISIAEIMHQVSMLDAPQSSEFWVTLIFNALLIGIGIVLGFLAHDSRDDFEKHYKNFHFKRPKLIKQFNALMDDSRTFSAVNGGEGSGVAHSLDLLIHLIELHNGLIQHIYNYGEYINSLCKEAINRYRVQNRSNRTDSDSIPSYWTQATNGEEYIIPEVIDPIRQDAYQELIHV